MTSTFLKTVASIQAGYQAKASIKENVKGTHYLIQTKDFDCLHCLMPDNLTAFFPERKPEIYSVCKGDILFQARGIAHFAGYIEADLKNTLASGSFYILRVKGNEIIPQYLAWWLNQSKAQAWLRAQARGTGISFVSKHTLSRLQVMIPPVSIQKKIVLSVALASREQFLLERLAQTRSRLVKAACLNAIQEQER